MNEEQKQETKISISRPTLVKIGLIVLVIALLGFAGADIDPGVKRGLELLLTNLLSGLAL